MINPVALRSGRPVELQPLVQRIRADAQTLRNLSNRIATLGDLMHRVPLEIVALVARPHVGLLTPKLGGKASTNLGARHTLG